jgi:pimeloyl-ACP methyl ester carboxylesterase
VVDIAPAPRPQAFWHTAQAVEQLRQMPLSSFRTIAEAEAWLLANGKPPEVFQQPESEWVVKYFLSNVSDARRTQEAAKIATSGSPASEVGTDSPLRWDIALDAIAEGGLKKLLWANDNCVASLGSSSLVLPPIPAAVDAPPSPAKLPTQFLFGGSSPYRTEVGLNAIPKYFSNARVSTIPNGTHFLFVSQRKAFCLELYKFLRDVHHEKYSHTSKL